jgi:hypothetical protein
MPSRTQVVGAAELASAPASSSARGGRYRCASNHL